MMPFARETRLLMRAGIAFVACVALTPRPALAQTHEPAKVPVVRGRVTDVSGRPLPFVIVTSRTSNGFLSVRSDLLGRFAFPGRRHAPNGQLSFKSAGFTPHAVRVSADSTDLVVTLSSNNRDGHGGWSLGLTEHAVLRLRAGDGRETAPEESYIGNRVYHVEVMSRGSRNCTRRGPGEMRVDSTFVTLSVAVFVRGGACSRDSVEHRWEFPVTFQGSGRGEVRLIGRTGDEVVPVTVIRP